MARRTDIGLHVVTKGRAKGAGGITWAEFVDRVAAQARRSGSRRGNADNMTNAGNIDTLWGQPIPKDRQCAFTWSKGDKMGKRCGNWAMKGATRCRAHGGYRQNPDHPATARRLNDILTLDAHKRAVNELRSAPHDARRAVEEALQAVQVPLRPVTVLQGIEALQMDDGGRAWRRFIRQASTAKPSEGKKARRSQLR